ncbi:MAG: class I SAM-dependent methyltransferase [Deltaproteobacteria bacterium]|nr:class I SAM-dependent methyltransferase [Candidatus Zymogenaceae bacterium]
MSSREDTNPFERAHYQKINNARMEHLLSLNLPIEGRSVLELGAGIGDLSPFFIDRAHDILIIEGRSENIDILQKRYEKSEFPHVDIVQMDLDWAGREDIDGYDIVFCYGLLYHLKDPIKFLDWVVVHCNQYMILETCVSTCGDVNNLSENKGDITQSLNGIGCRPGRRWLFEELKKRFRYVYTPYTQPNHEQFPDDWVTTTDVLGLLTRSIFIASKYALNNGMLFEGLLDRQSIG